MTEATLNLRDRLVKIRDSEPLERAKLLSFAAFRAALPTQELKDAFDAHSLTSTFADTDAVKPKVREETIVKEMRETALLDRPWPFPKKRAS